MQKEAVVEPPNTPKENNKVDDVFALLGVDLTEKDVNSPEKVIEIDNVKSDNQEKPEIKKSLEDMSSDQVEIKLDDLSI